MAVVSGDQDMQLFKLKNWQYNLDLEPAPFSDYDPDTLWLKVVVYEENSNYDCSDIASMPFTVIKSNYNQKVSELE